MLPITAFLSFIFYRVLSTYLFDTPISVLASAIMGVITAFVALGLTLAYARILERRHQPFGIYVGGALVVAIAANALVGWLIVQGFSPDFTKRFGWYGHESDWIWWLVLAAIPLMAHTIAIYAIGRNVR